MFWAAGEVESEMTQPAKAQEPSMEEILASIRRIISDDEAKPAATAAVLEPAKAEAPRTEPFKTEPPRVALHTLEAPAPAAKPVAEKSVSTPAAPPSPPPAAAKNNQDDIDAMMADFGGPAASPKEQDIDPDSDVFELTEQMAMADMPSPGPAFRESPIAPTNPKSSSFGTSAYSEPSVPPVKMPSESSHPMLANSTAVAVESAFNALASTVLSNNARTLEDLVKEMLRPMLKSWLDDNLPNLVERIVKSEIERVSRGR
jgi:cell pole-organizing protein PopZ